MCDRLQHDHQGKVHSVHSPLQVVITSTAKRKDLPRRVFFCNTSAEETSYEKSIDKSAKN